MKNTQKLTQEERSHFECSELQHLKVRKQPKIKLVGFSELLYDNTINTHKTVRFTYVQSILNAVIK